MPSRIFGGCPPPPPLGMHAVDLRLRLLKVNCPNLRQFTLDECSSLSALGILHRGPEDTEDPAAAATPAAMAKSLQKVRTTNRRRLRRVDLTGVDPRQGAAPLPPPHREELAVLRINDCPTKVVVGPGWELGPEAVQALLALHLGQLNV